jgi:hypothetical protein
MGGYHQLKTQCSLYPKNQQPSTFHRKCPQPTHNTHHHLEFSTNHYFQIHTHYLQSIALSSGEFDRASLSQGRTPHRRCYMNFPALWMEGLSNTCKTPISSPNPPSTHISSFHFKSTHLIRFFYFNHVDVGLRKKWLAGGAIRIYWVQTKSCRYSLKDRECC